MLQGAANWEVLLTWCQKFMRGASLSSAKFISRNFINMAKLAESARTCLKLLG